MYSTFFFIVGLVNLVVAVVLFTQGEVMVGICITMIGLSCTIRNGMDILQKKKKKNGRVSS